MALRNEALFDKGNVASIYEETLSDGSYVYNVRVYDYHDESKYAEIEAIDEKHADKIFQAIEVTE